MAGDEHALAGKRVFAVHGSALLRLAKLLYDGVAQSFAAGGGLIKEVWTMLRRYNIHMIARAGVSGGAGLLWKLVGHLAGAHRLHMLLMDHPGASVSSSTRAFRHTAA